MAKRTFKFEDNFQREVQNEDGDALQGPFLHPWVRY